jgi:hypothetical protein
MRSSYRAVGRVLRHIVQQRAYSQAVQMEQCVDINRLRLSILATLHDAREISTIEQSMKLYERFTPTPVLYINGTHILYY